MIIYSLLNEIPVGSGVGFVVVGAFTRISYLRQVGVLGDLRYWFRKDGCPCRVLKVVLTGQGSIWINFLTLNRADVLQLLAVRSSCYSISWNWNWNGNI